MKALLAGFFICISLIFAIGAQNALVLRCGLLRQHVGLVVLFCIVSDMLLITFGVVGFGSLLQGMMATYSHWLFGITALWLIGYGLLRLRDVFNKNTMILSSAAATRWQTLLSCALVTWLNPHVYLDTVLLVGSYSLQYQGVAKQWFTLGAYLASIVFFTALGYGSRYLSRWMTSAFAWQIINAVIAGVMFALAVVMVQSIDFG